MRSVMTRTVVRSLAPLAMLAVFAVSALSGQAPQKQQADMNNLRPSAMPSPAAAIAVMMNFFMLVSFAPRCAPLPLLAAPYGRSLGEETPYGSHIVVAVNPLQTSQS